MSKTAIVLLVLVVLLSVLLGICTIRKGAIAADYQRAGKRIADLEAIRERQRLANLELVAANNRLATEIGNLRDIAGQFEEDYRRLTADYQRLRDGIAEIQATGGALSDNSRRRVESVGRIERLVSTARAIVEDL
jgi:hypothetical protein